MVSTIGLFLGRIANFINGELWGRVTDVSWAVIFPKSDGLPRHPSQLYEALCEGFILFLILMCSTFVFKTPRKTGLNSGLFLTLYAIFRMILENYREPDDCVGYIWGYFTMGQLLSIPMLIFGLYLIANAKTRK